MGSSMNTGEIHYNSLLQCPLNVIHQSHIFLPLSSYLRPCFKNLFHNTERMADKQTELKEVRDGRREYKNQPAAKPKPLEFKDH